MRRYFFRGLGTSGDRRIGELVSVWEEDARSGAAGLNHFAGASLLLFGPGFCWPLHKITGEMMMPDPGCQAHGSKFALLWLLDNRGNRRMRDCLANKTDVSTMKTRCASSVGERCCASSQINLAGRCHQLTMQPHRKDVHMDKGFLVTGRGSDHFS